jgi:hypothetical protein
MKRLILFVFVCLPFAFAGCQKGIDKGSNTTTSKVVSSDQFVTLIFDGKRDSINRTQFYSLMDTMYADGNAYGSGFTLVAAAGWTLGFSVSNTSIGTGNFIRQLFIVAPGVSGVFLTPDLAGIAIHITEYGAPGDYIAGNFSGTAKSGGVSHVLSCSFRMKRLA